MIRKNVRLIAMALSCGIVTLPAGADGLSVSPTSISVSADVNMATLTVKADGKKRVLGQVRVVSWNRAGGNNDIAPTRNVVASPPSLNIAPNQEITVRIVRKAESAVRSKTATVFSSTNCLSLASPIVLSALRYASPIPLCFD